LRWPTPWPRGLVPTIASRLGAGERMQCAQPFKGKVTWSPCTTTRWRCPGGGSLAGGAAGLDWTAGLAGAAGPVAASGTTGLGDAEAAAITGAAGAATGAQRLSVRHQRRRPIGERSGSRPRHQTRGRPGRTPDPTAQARQLLPPHRTPFRLPPRSRLPSQPDRSDRRPLDLRLRRDGTSQAAAHEALGRRRVRRERHGRRAGGEEWAGRSSTAIALHSASATAQGGGATAGNDSGMLPPTAPAPRPLGHEGCLAVAAGGESGTT
jgi:hypothetical protein